VLNYMMGYGYCYIVNELVVIIDRMIVNSRIDLLIM